MTTLSLAIQRVRRAKAIFEASLAALDRVVNAEEDLENSLVDATERLGRRVFKPLRLAPRTEPIGAATQTRNLFQRVIQPILVTLGQELITGSGTFTRDQLRDATIRVFWNTENGHFAEMRFIPQGEPFYAVITPEEARLLARPLPPTNLIARLFTELEDTDN